MAERPPTTPLTDDELLAASLALADQVVYRGFDAETVVLHLRTGVYYGLNPTAARMLEVLQEQPSVAGAVAVLVDEYDASAEQIGQDALRLCRDLLERELVVVPLAS